VSQPTEPVVPMDEPRVGYEGVAAEKGTDNARAGWGSP